MPSSNGNLPTDDLESLRQTCTVLSQPGRLEILAALRAKGGMTQKQLAHSLGLDPREGGAERMHLRRALWAFEDIGLVAKARLSSRAGHPYAYRLRREACLVFLTHLGSLLGEAE